MKKNQNQQSQWRNGDRPLQPARVTVSVVCPCGFGLNEVTSDDPARDMLQGPLRAVCDSCGLEFAITPAAVQAAQHECLRILGEAE